MKTCSKSSWESNWRSKILNPPTLIRLLKQDGSDRHIKKSIRVASTIAERRWLFYRPSSSPIHSGHVGVILRRCDHQSIRRRADQLLVRVQVVFLGLASDIQSFFVLGFRPNLQARSRHIRTVCAGYKIPITSRTIMTYRTTWPNVAGPC